MVIFFCIFVIGIVLDFKLVTHRKAEYEINIQLSPVKDRKEEAQIFSFEINILRIKCTVQEYQLACCFCETFVITRETWCITWTV